VVSGYRGRSSLGENKFLVVILVDKPVGRLGISFGKGRGDPGFPGSPLKLEGGNSGAEFFYQIDFLLIVGAPKIKIFGLPWVVTVLDPLI
jgi:hypothetical protein